MLIIRPETAADTDAIRGVHTAAFPTPAEAQLVDALRAAGKIAVSLVAEVDGTVRGHLLLSPVELCGVCAAGGGLGLAPIAVEPAYQGRGAGSALICESMAAARRLGARYVVVLGEPDYYSRFGFETASRYGLANEYDAGDAFMVRLLRPGALPPEGGLISYAAEFAVAGTEANP